MFDLLIAPVRRFAWRSDERRTATGAHRLD
jgi:hypothetical protein